MYENNEAGLHGHRQLHRIATIHAAIKSNEYPSADRLATRFEVDRRTILRDIAFIKSEYNAPVEYDRGRKGYYYSDDTFEIPAFELTEGELFAVYVADKVLTQYRGAPFYDQINGIFEKIKGQFTDRTTLSFVDTDFTFLTDTVPKIDPGIWKQVFQAVESRCDTIIVYQSLKYADETSITVQPLHVVCHRSNWYLIARNVRQDRVNIYSFLRIKRVRILDRRFEYPEGFTLDDLLEGSFGIFTSDQRYDVRIRFSAGVARLIHEQEWHRDQVLEDQPDGSVIFSLTVNHLLEIKRWILSWGTAAEVLAPQELRDEIKTDARAMSALYDG